MSKPYFSLFLPAVFLLFHASCAFAAGETSANFLKIAVGARNAAMGETGATETGVNAIYWNPAGMADVENIDASFSHASWFEGVNLENAACAMKVGNSVFGASIDYLSMSSIDRYDNTGGSQGSFSPSDKALRLSYATDISATPEKTYAGVILKYISSDIDSLSANTLAVDAGVFFDTLFEDLRLGVVFQNLGTPMKFDQKAYSLPLNLKAGANYLVTDGLSVSLDINKAIDTGAVFNTGGEYVYPVNDETGIAVRGGYKSGMDGLGGSAGITIGFGIIYQSYSFDYAFVPYGDLGDTQRISIGCRF